MARIRPITSPEGLTEEGRRVYQAIAQSRGRVFGPFALLLRVPALAERVAELGSHVRFRSGLAADLREVAILTTAREMDCPYEWAHHLPLALEAGVAEATARAIGEGAPLDGAPPAQATVVDFARQLLGGHRVAEDTYRRAVAELGEEGVVELAATVGYYAMLACVLNAFELLPEAGTPSLPRRAPPS